jgi:hypothetical protein
MQEQMRIRETQLFMIPQLSLDTMSTKLEYRRCLIQETMPLTFRCLVDLVLRTSLHIIK